MKKSLYGLLLGAALLLALPASGPSQDTSAPGGRSVASVEERRILTELQEERRRLLDKEEKLALREMELKTLQGEVDKKLDELQRRREELAQMLAQKDEEEVKKARELSKMYEKMDAARAAQVIASLEKELAVAILEGMRAKSAGKILASMEREVAAGLTVSYSSLEE